MKLPRMTPKRWFWSLVAAGFCISLAGTRGNVAWLPTAQARVVEQPVDFVVAPGEFIFGSVQTSVSTAVRGKGVDDGHGGETSDTLRAELRGTENDLAEERAWRRDLEAKLSAIDQLSHAGMAPGTYIEADVVARQSGTGTSTLQLAKGSMDGVTEGAPVCAAVAADGKTLQGVTLLGRVETVLAKECVVRLLTDPTSRVQVQIVRPSIRPPADSRITGQTVLAYGLGSNQMDIRDVVVDPAHEPQDGDLVQLVDNQYPKSAQYMVIGQIDHVGRRSDNALLYELHVTPRVAITALHTVIILTK